MRRGGRPVNAVVAHALADEPAVPLPGIGGAPLVAVFRRRMHLAQEQITVADGVAAEGDDVPKVAQIALATAGPGQTIRRKRREQCVLLPRELVALRAIRKIRAVIHHIRAEADGNAARVRQLAMRTDPVDAVFRLDVSDARSRRLWWCGGRVVPHAETVGLWVAQHAHVRLEAFVVFGVDDRLRQPLRRLDHAAEILLRRDQVIVDEQFRARGERQRTARSPRSGCEKRPAP